MSIQCQDSPADSDTGNAIDMTAFGQRLRDWRKRAKLSQKQLAAASGLRQPSLSAIENGDTKAETLRAGNLIRMARALQVSAEELYTGRVPTLDAKTGTPQDSVLRLLYRMSAQSVEAWIENGETLLRHQAPVRLAESPNSLHTTGNGEPAQKAKGCTTEAELLAVHGREETNRIIAEEVARDDARKAAKPPRAKKRAGKQQSSNGAT